MSKPAKTPKRRFRFRFRLSTFLFLVTAIGVSAGVWVGWVEPVRKQWAAVDPLLDRGAQVETSPSKLPEWMKKLLPTGKTENIEALFFKNTTKLTSDDLKCLSRLPHLKRLYLERSGLDDQGVAWIAACPSIERLSIWGNSKVTNKTAPILASLPNLKLIDLHDTGMNWRTMIEFDEKPQTKVVEDFRFYALKSSELEVLAKINNKAGSLDIKGADATTIPRTISLFPYISYFNITGSDALTQDNIQLVKSHRRLQYIQLDLQETPAEKDWWRMLLGEMDASDLYYQEKNLSIPFRFRHSTRDSYFSIEGVSSTDFAQLREIGGLSTITNCSLYKLDFPEVEELDFLSWLSNLKSLKLYNCQNPQRIDFALMSPKLESVKLEICDRLTEIENLVGLPQLKSLKIDRCPVKTIRNINLPASTELEISFPTPQENVVNFDFLEDVKSLGNLRLSYCHGLKDLNGIENIPGLKKLRIEFCHSINDWSALYKCRELKELTFDLDFGRAQKLPPPNLDFLNQLDKFCFASGARSANQTWIDAWAKIIESRKAAANGSSP